MCQDITNPIPTDALLKSQLFSYPSGFLGTGAAPSGKTGSSYIRITLECVPEPALCRVSKGMEAAFSTSMKPIKSRHHVLVLHSLLLLLLTVAGSQATTRQAVSLSLADVQSAINASSAGDTVVLQTGTATWSGGVNINKPITVQGAGIGLTVITAGSGTAPFTITTTSTTQLTRLTGVTVDGNRQAECVQLQESGVPYYGLFRLDHCRLIHANNYYAFDAEKLVAGVVDHCRFEDNYLHFGCDMVTDLELSWQLPCSVGTSNNIVFEDNSFIHTSGGYRPFQGAFENGHGSRIIFRYNTITNFSTSDQPCFDIHGNQAVVNTNTDSSGNSHRGCRNTEFYCNTFVASPNGGVKLYYRGGVLLLYSNTWIGSSWDSGLKVDEEDSAVRFGYLSKYPGYDMHWFWGWNNTQNGSAMANTWYSGMTGNYNDTSDAIFLTSANFQWVRPSTAHPGYPELFLAPAWQTSKPITNYTPLVYPHPLITAGSTGTNGPVISNEEVFLISTNAAMITWTTDQPATSIVDYGTNSSYGTSVTNTSLVVSHTNVISGLNNISGFHYRVRSSNASGTFGAPSPDYTFPIPPPLNLRAIAVTNAPAGN